MSDATQPVIVYFEIRGRAEPIRLMLEHLGIDYRDEFVSGREWMRFKRTTPFGKVPIYKEGEQVIPESHAIVRYLARKHDLGGQDEAETIQCDVLGEVLHDASEAMGRLFWDPHFEDNRENFVNKRLTRTLDSLEDWLQTHSVSEQFWVGSGLTYVDFIGWACLDMVRMLAPGLLDHYPRLSALKQAFEQRPAVAAYLQSPRRPETFTVPMAAFGNTPETS